MIIDVFYDAEAYRLNVRRVLAAYPYAAYGTRVRRYGRFRTGEREPA